MEAIEPFDERPSPHCNKISANLFQADAVGCTSSPCLDVHILGPRTLDTELGRPRSVRPWLLRPRAFIPRLASPTPRRTGPTRYSPRSIPAGRSGDSDFPPGRGTRTRSPLPGHFVLRRGRRRRVDTRPCPESHRVGVLATGRVRRDHVVRTGGDSITSTPTCSSSSRNPQPHTRRAAVRLQRRPQWARCDANIGSPIRLDSE